VCALNKHAEEVARQTRRDQERATEAMQDAMAEQSERLAEEFERSRQATEEQAFETQMAIAEAAEEHRKALTQAAEEHERTTANAWKLQSHAKSEEAYTLYQSGMFDEALQLALEAIKQDPGNIDGAFVIGASLEAQSKTEQARPYLIKQLQMLKLPQYRTQMKYHRQVFRAIGTDKPLIDTFCSVMEDNVESWSQCGSIESAETIVSPLVEKRQYRPALLVGATPAAMVSTRKLICKFSHIPGGLGQWRTEIGAIANWLELMSNRADARGSNTGGKCRSLVVTAFAEDTYSQLGIEKKLVAGFFREVKLENRETLEKDLGILKELCAREEFGAELFSQVMNETKIKYLGWESEIKQGIYNAGLATAEREPSRKFGCLLGFVSVFLFQVLGLIVAQLISGGNPSRGSGIVATLGGFFGAFLVPVLSLHVLDCFRRYRVLRTYLAGAVKGVNAAREQLDIPPVSQPDLRARSPRIDLGVAAGIFAIFLIAWPLSIWRFNGPSHMQAVLQSANSPISENATKPAETLKMDRNAKSALSIASSSSKTGPNELAITEMVSEWATAYASNDVEAEIAFYAPLVDPFYNRHNVSRETVLQIRQNLFNKGVRLSKYEAGNITVTMNSNDEATVDLEKLWSTRPAGSMPIHTRSQLHVRNVNGKWLITGEKDL
jgi:tetratricopeptide (TPR) repeat protein